MQWSEVSFWVLAAVATFSALGVVIFRNAVYSMLSLIVNLVSLALFFLMLQSLFIATIQVLVYAGAVMVLFLFVVTMLSPDSQHVGTTDRSVGQWFAGIGLGVILAGALIYASVNGAIARDLHAANADRLSVAVAHNGSTQTFGLGLFHGFSFPFEVTSVLLVIAVLGAVVLGRRIMGRE